MQRHRDDWRGYVYGERPRPADYLDGGGPDGGTYRAALHRVSAAVRAWGDVPCDETAAAVVQAQDALGAVRGRS